jgi:hypothetical protein
MLLVWGLGFGWFALLLPQPLDGRTTDAIVVLTAGRAGLIGGLRSCVRERPSEC